MASELYDIRQLVARLSTPRFRAYLTSQGWEEKPSRYVDHIYFEVKSDDGSDPFDLYLPVSAEVPNYHTRVMRAIYKLCGIEDREPLDIAKAVFACDPASDDRAGSLGKSYVRVRNSGTTPLQLRVDQPVREYLLASGDAIELNCQLTDARSLQIERGDSSLTIHTRGPE
jgi:hypothetical protein